MNMDRSIIDEVTLRRDLYLLMGLLLADKQVRAEGADWTVSFFDKEVSRLMMWTALANRSLLDSLPQKEGRLFGSQPCGEYWRGFPIPQEGDLTFRQACSAAIHAEEIVPYEMPTEEFAPSERPVYEDRLTARGTDRRGATIRAYINIVEYVQLADQLMTTLAGEDHANR